MKPPASRPVRDPLEHPLRHIVGGFAIAIGLTMAAQTAFVPASWPRFAGIAATFALAYPLTLALVRRGRGALAARLYSGTLFAMVAALTWTAGGVKAPSLTSFVPVILVTGTLLGFRLGGLAALLASLWALWLVAAETFGWLPPPQVRHTPASIALTQILNLALLALVLRLSSEERRRSAEAISASERRLAFALEATADGLYDVNLATGATYCSPRYFTMLGYGEGELPASLETWRQLLHPEDRPIAEAAMARYVTELADTHSIETRLRTKSGSWRWVISRGRITERAADGRPVRLIGTHIDITERKEAELALRKAKDFAEKLIANANALIVCLDRTGAIVVFNATAESATGYAAAEVLGRNWFETLVPRTRYPQVWAEFERLGAAGIPVHYENPVLTKAGEERIVAWRNSILREGDTAVGTISFGIDVTERRRTEHALAKQRDLVARLVETSPSGILVVDTAGEVVFANLEAERILDLRPLAGSAAYAAADWTLLNPDGSPVPEADRVFRRVLASGRPVRGVRHLLVWESGRRVLLSINAAPLLDAAGRAEGVVSTIEDITERQHAENLRLENEERLRSVVDHAPFGSHLYRLEPDGRLVFQGANRSADAILHLDHSPLVGREITAAFPGLAGTDLPDTYRRVVTEGRPYHCAEVRYDADSISGAFDVHALPIGRGRLVVFFVDITERERAAAALRRSEERYRQLFNAGNDALFVHGFEADGAPGRFVQVNDIACSLLGYTREELLARAPRDLSTPAQLARIAGVVEQLHRDRHALFEMELVARDGRAIPTEINSRVFDLDGRPTVLSVVRDATERRALEAQLRQAQKMEVFGQLAGGVAHDFNNLLVAILGNSDLLLERPEFAGHAREQLQQIGDAGRRAAALTRQLLLFARKQPPLPVPADLGQIVGNHVKLLRRIIGEDIALVVELAAEPLPVLADVNMVEQVAMNLVVNARDAMPAGGTLTLRTARAALDETAAARRLCPPGRYAAFAVRDTGGGIPPELRQRIFEPFFTTKTAGQGTGLGLSTVLGIVQQHHGGIALESEVGRGSEFTIYLPLTEHTSTPPPALSPEAPRAAAPAKILVVEDDEAVRAIVGRTLRAAGYQVDTASSAAEALAALQAGPARFDLVLSDIVMPGGESGVDLAATVAARWPRLPVCLMSGYTKGLADTSTRVLQKPFTTAQLLAFVREGLVAT